MDFDSSLSSQNFDDQMVSPVILKLDSSTMYFSFRYFASYKFKNSAGEEAIEICPVWGLLVCLFVFFCLWGFCVFMDGFVFFVVVWVFSRSKWLLMF